METEKTQPVSVIAPIGESIDKTKAILFAPFSLEKWLVIGFCAWLAGLGIGGGSSIRVNMPFDFVSDFSPCPSGVGHIGQDAGAWLGLALPWLVPVALSGVLIMLAVALLVVWVKSRGQFMFLDCIICNRGAVSAPWTAYRNEGNSLFGFRFVVWLAFVALMLAVVVPLGLFLATVARPEFTPIFILPTVAGGLFLTLLWLGYSLFAVLTDDFVVPVMLLRRCGVIAAWKEFFALLTGRLGYFVLYLLVIFAANIVIAALGFMVVFSACCCFCCVSWMFLIPLLGGYLLTVLLLPLRVWRRSYALLFLAQCGAAYDVFAAAQTPAPPSP